jgi:hypothetical protein
MVVEEQVELHVVAVVVVKAKQALHQMVHIQMVEVELEEVGLHLQ